MPDLLDIEERIAELGGALPSVRRQNWLDILVLGIVLFLGAVAVTSPMLGAPAAVRELSTILLVAMSFVGAYTRMVARPDHVRALQSDRMLNIANASLAYLRRGLTPDTAREVCRIVLRESDASAVAFTDLHEVLGFAGVGEDHHLVGGSIITRATMEALENNEPGILHNRDDIGCPDPECSLRAAIVVPLEVRQKPVGTIKFYYTSDRYLNETELAMGEGLARLLSTQLELSELDRQTELATEMELKALQAQINPHFLFNTINTIAAFIRTEPDEARRLLRQFATFYRRTLEQTEDLVTVRNELDFVETYIELEKARFGDRLQVSEDIDPGAESLPLPAFMIQPLVENSVGHGMKADGSTLHVEIAAKIEGDALCISVSDDGRGIRPDRLPHIMESGAGKGLGIALMNVRERLRGYFGPESGFEISSAVNEGTTVRLTIAPLPVPSADDTDAGAGR
jgi:two-component system sensor histidine kinase LytS